MEINKQAAVALASGTITLFVFGSIYTFGTLIPYFSAYLYYHNDATSSAALSLLFTVMVLTLNIGVGVEKIICKKLSNRVICVLAVFGLCISILVSSFMTTFIGFLVFYGLMYGFFIGVGYFPPLKNAFLHLPARKGLCSGICCTGFGLGSAVFNYLILGLINPNNTPLDPITKMYPPQIAANLPFALKIIAAVYFGLGIVSSLFIREPMKQDQDASLIRQQNNQAYVRDPHQQQFQTLFQFFKRKRAYLIMAQIALIAPFGTFTAFNYKRIAFERNSVFLENDYLVTTVGSIAIFSNGIFRTGWGYLNDNISFKKIIVTIGSLLFIFSAAILFAVQNVVAYFFIIPFIYLCYGGLYVILPTQTIRVLGHKNGSRLFWLTFGGFSIASIIQFTLQYFILTYVGSDKGYYICCGVFCFLELCGIILSLKVNYDYEDEEKKMMHKSNHQQADSYVPGQDEYDGEYTNQDPVGVGSSHLSKDQ